MSSFEAIMQEMQRHSMKVPTERLTLELEGAKGVLQNALKYFLKLEGKRLEWLPEYEEVAGWLSSNEGRGLFLYGNCGRGKSLMVRYVLPAIFLKYFHKVVNVYDVQEMNRGLDEVLTKRIVSLDDVGTEEVVNVYGNRRMAFAEVMDAVEKQGKLILISTNLQERDLREQYGDRVLDRIKACTKRILFSGESLRE